jgi:hypothetical protein
MIEDLIASLFAFFFVVITSFAIIDISKFLYIKLINKLGIKSSIVRDFFISTSIKSKQKGDNANVQRPQ